MPHIWLKAYELEENASSEQDGHALPASGLDSLAILVQRAQNGDEQAANELILQLEGKIYGLAFRLAMGNEEEAKDLFQEACYRILSNLKKFNGKSSFSTWMYRVATNAAVSALRRNKRWSRFNQLSRKSEALEQIRGSSADQGEPDTDPLQVFVNRRLRHDLRTALKELSFKQQLVFQLKVFEDLSLAEISEVSGMAQGTVKSHLARATKHIRNKLSAWTKDQ